MIDPDIDINLYFKNVFKLHSIYTKVRYKIKFTKHWTSYEFNVCANSLVDFIGLEYSERNILSQRAFRA